MKFKLDVVDQSKLDVSRLKDLGVGWNGGSSSWIEIETLEELMEFEAIFGALIISSFSGPEICIYNDYTES